MQKTVKLYDGSVTLHFSDQARNRYTIEETGSSPVGVTSVLQTLNKPALMTWPMWEALKSVELQVSAWIDKQDGSQLELKAVIAEASNAYLIRSDSGKSAGTAIHAAIEAYLTGGGEIPTPEVQKALSGFIAWHKQQINPKTIAVEEIIYSKQYNYAGTLDGIMEIDGQTILFDIKTNNASRVAPLGIYPEHFLQLGAYSLAYKEQNEGILFPEEEPYAQDTHFADKPDEKFDMIAYNPKKIDDLAIIRVGKDGKVNTLRASELGLSVPDCEQAWLSVLQAYRFLTPLTKTLKEKK